ncbi:unnamed protein product [Clonostachys byssicola]|uniref:Uncharacterized protein n=1 Tax=Clonostachys byssicola TaxID=160290 RepID=A0A9N9UT13_9HYPO|nr:unnamed protein product [Clonostachys byssicola]
MDQTDADLPPPMSRVKHNRIDIWRNEVAALTLDTAVDTTDDPAGHSPPPSSAISSASSSSSFLSLSSPAASRGRRFWRRLSHRLTGRPLDPSPPDVARTDMYRTEQSLSSPRHNPPKDLGRRGRAEADALGEESSRDGLQGALGAKQDRLERAARLLEEGPVRE